MESASSLYIHAESEDMISDATHEEYPNPFCVLIKASPQREIDTNGIYLDFIMSRFFIQHLFSLIGLLVFVTLIHQLMTFYVVCTH